MLLSGYYGFGNLGDEALLEVIVDRMRRRFPSAQLEVLSATPASNRRELSGRGRTALGLARDSQRNRAGRRRALRRRGVATKCDESSQPALLRGDSARGNPRAAQDDDLRAIGRTARFLGPARRSPLLQRPRSRDGARRAIAPALSRARSANADRADGRSGLLIRMLPKASRDLSADGLGPESGPYAVVSVRKSVTFRDGPAIVARVVDRLAQHHDDSHRVSAAGRRRRRRRLDRRHSRLQIESDALAGVHACASGLDSARCASRRRHAAALAHSRRALRRAVSRDRLRSEGPRALRGPAVSARTALAFGRAATERRRDRRCSSIGSCASTMRSRRSWSPAGKPFKRPRSETSTCSASF